MKLHARPFAVLPLLLSLPLAASAAEPNPPAVHPGMDHTMMHSAAMHGAMPGLTPTQPGEETFGTIAEIVNILEATPDTDWSKVNIPALRKHLIDMKEVAANANAEITRLPTGVRIKVTGNGRTLEAIQRMVTMHALTMNGSAGWKFSNSPLPDGELLTVESDDPAQAIKIQGLGFMGIMVYGTHHGMHHLAIARGEMEY